MRSVSVVIALVVLASGCGETGPDGQPLTFEVVSTCLKSETAFDSAWMTAFTPGISFSSFLF